MATKITSRVIAPGAVTAEALAPGVGAGPVIANVQIANSSYVALDDTAVALDGGYILINGENFGENVQVIIANTNATSVTYISSSLVRAQMPAKSAGSYIMYLVNTDTGATAIRVNAVTYSGTPTWSTGSTLTEGSVDEAISIQLSATADSNVLYQLQTGSTLPTGLTLAANGLLSGTVTGITEDTLYNFTIEAVDAENQDSPRAFSITITAGDQIINSVVLALNADSNTFITDSSTNSFAITPNGDTRPSAFSPYNTSWSNFFDGTGDYLSIGYNSAFDVGSNAASVECWVYFSVAPTTQIINGQNSGVGSTMRMGVWSSTFRYTINDDTLRDTGITPVAGIWYHLCLTITGGVARFFINGVLRKTDSGLGNVSNRAETYFIGTEDTANINGYISDFRFCNGSIPTSYQTSSTTVGAAIFSPPTSQLTTTSQGATSSHVKILTCQSNRLIDNSTNNFTITRNGDVRVTSFGPFTETDTTTGSGYFDGDADYIQGTDNDAFDFGTGDFTIECWFMRTATPATTYHGIVGANGSGFNGWSLYYTNGDEIMMFGDAGSLRTTSGASITNNVWYHVAVVKASNVLKIYVNGVERYSVADTTQYNCTANGWRIGDDANHANGWMNGYISNLRIVKGTAVYTSAFTPPTSPLTAISGTSLLTLQNRISYNNSQPVDESGVKNIVTRAGNASVGSYTPYTPAGWSAYFDGTGDYLSIASGMNVGSSNFTIEAWVYPTAWTVEFTSIFSTRASNSTGGATDVWVLGVHNSGYPYIYSGAFQIQGSAGQVVLNTWTHLAVSRSGSTMRLFVNGSLVQTSTSSQDYTQAAGAIGANRNGSEQWTGYISNLQLTTSTLYTSNFTPSTTPLEPIANTSLLTLRGPSFTDDGPNRFAITRNGDTRITPFSPFKTHTIVPDSHSVYFDGTGDYLSLASPVVAATGDFTIEGWFLTPTTGTRQDLFYQTSPTLALDGRLIINLSADGTFAGFVGGTGAPGVISSTTVVIPNTWYHFAYVRSSNTFSLYINGTREGTQPTSTISIVQQPLILGYNPFNAYYWNGYISNLRVINGTALYTFNFTPSTTPLTNIANTSLLTCQSPTVIDNSNNAFAITVNGEARPAKFNPFGETVTTGVQYSPASHGGSYYFDGTGDYLNTPATGQFAPAGAFTIECFVYITSLAAIRTIIGNYTTNATTDWMINVTTAGVLRAYTNGSTARISSASGAITIGQWYHVTLSRDSSNVISLFLNGVLIGTYSQSGTFGVATKAIYIGVQNVSTNPMLGYISNLRMVESSALYTSAFVPPAAPPSPVAGTTLLLNGTNAAIADGVGKNVLETVGNARIINGTKKYGTGSMHFPTSSYLINKDAAINLSNSNFTVEFWVNSPSDEGGSPGLVIIDSALTGDFAGLAIVKTGVFVSYAGTAWNIFGASLGALNDGTWRHLAIVRNGSNLLCFNNGTLQSNTSITSPVFFKGPAVIVGKKADNYTTGNSYIDDLRITKGVARYTSNFTPPTSSFKLK